MHSSIHCTSSLLRTENYYFKTNLHFSHEKGQARKCELSHPLRLYQQYSTTSLRQICPQWNSQYDRHNYNGAGVGTLISGESKWSIFAGKWGTSCWLPILSCKESYNLCIASLCWLVGCKAFTSV